MKEQALRLYLLDGKRVAEIATELSVSEAKVRGLLFDAGLRVRERGGRFNDLGREQVCAAVAWRGYNSFHEFVTAKGLVSFGEMAASLHVGERVFVRVFELYRKLLERTAAPSSPGIGTGESAPSERPPLHGGATPGGQENSR